jgi:hypothetical protein
MMLAHVLHTEDDRRGAGRQAGQRAQKLLPQAVMSTRMRWNTQNFRNVYIQHTCAIRSPKMKPTPLVRALVSKGERCSAAL